LLVTLVILLAIIALIWFFPLQIRLHFTQRAWEAKVELRVKAPLISGGATVDISDKVAMALEHMWKRWRATGEPVKIPLQKTIRRMPRAKLLRIISVPGRYLGRRIRCSRLAIKAEIGGFDAMESALLAGAGWGFVGSALAIVSGYIRLDPATPEIAILPIFAGPAWRVDSDCILRLRLGHAIVAGIWLLRRVMAEREVVAWARDSWRRKGVEDDGRASHSGPDEDGHGEP
jgi:hypothetical protein